MIIMVFSCSGSMWTQQITVLIPTSLHRTFYSFIIHHMSTNVCLKLKQKTRMHSSRMRTVRLLPVSPSITGGVCSRGGCLLRGCLPLVRGGDGVYPSMQWGRPPPVDRMTDRCKNITLPQTSFAGSNKPNSFRSCFTVEVTLT